MSDPERRALTLTLLGTGKRGEPPGPLDSGWVVKHLAGTRTTLQRWRERGVPPDRLDDLLDAVRGLSLETQQNAAPEIPERLECLQASIDAIITRPEVYEYVDGIRDLVVAEIQENRKAIAEELVGALARQVAATLREQLPQLVDEDAPEKQNQSASAGQP